MSIVKWRWKDDEGNTHQYLVENTLYFPHSLINILSVTDFAKQLNNKEGTGIDTKQLRSCFYWDGNKHSLTISTPTHDKPTNLPEMQTNQEFSASRMYSALFFRVINTATDFRYSCCFTSLPDPDICHGCTGCDSAACATDVKQDFLKKARPYSPHLMVGPGWPASNQ